MTSRRTKISPKTWRGLGHVTHTIFGSTVGYPSDSLASCLIFIPFNVTETAFCFLMSRQETNVNSRLVINSYSLTNTRAVRESRIEPANERVLNWLHAVIIAAISRNCKRSTQIFKRTCGFALSPEPPTSNRRTLSTEVML